ncbi:MAG TPA: DNA repair protein RecO [Candidatus Dormibacteraeota bacterium]|nr:DNA repair protein RecO [Candidatus Dormibacteraeota bacterium]
MPAKESEAIILRTYPLGEGDRLVSFLSRSVGRIRGVAAGARRTKSRFGATLEVMSYVRIWFFERETRDLVRINQCELLETFLGAQREYNLNVALALISEVTEGVLPEREASDAVFRLLLVTARTIERTASICLPLAYFSLWTVRLGGWLPPLDRCSSCDKELKNDVAYHAQFAHGLACRGCRSAGASPMPVESRLLAQRMFTEQLERLAEEKIAGETAGELTNFMLDLIEHHLEKKLITRRMMEPRS